MRTSAALRPPRSNDVCLFCATRLGLASKNAQRMPFRSTRQFRISAASAKPPGYSTAARELDGNEVSESSNEKPAFGGGWGKPTFQPSQKLSAREEKQRMTLLSRQGDSRSQPQPLNGNFTPQPQGNIFERMRKNLPRVDQRRDVARRSEKTYDDWSCWNCRNVVFSWRKTCPRCGASRERGSPSSDSHGPTRSPAPSPAASLPGDTNAGFRSVNIRKFTYAEESETSAEAEESAATKREKAFQMNINRPTSNYDRNSGFVPLRPGNVSLPSRRDTGIIEESRHQRAHEDVPTSRGLRRGTGTVEESRHQRVDEEVSTSRAYDDPRRSRRPKNVRNAEDDIETTSSKSRNVPRSWKADNFDEDFEEGRRRKKDKKKDKKKNKAQNKAPVPIYLPEFISVGNLADVLGVRPATFLEKMEDLGFEGATNGHVLDSETAGLIAAEYGFDPIFDTDAEDLKAAPMPEDTSDLPSRPPVVTIMGHVDHGKTTILDFLRKSSVAASEFGGITQHIGAFSVPMPSGKLITFLDTPGHAAFLDMRRRGADVTDIVILVVAADDSVKPQTIEAIKHAKEARVPIIVAINKIDKEGANPDKVKQDLARHNIAVEDYGGDVQAVCVSGKTGQGMLELEEAAVTLSELLDHRAAIDCNAEGWVIEATTKKAGRVATVLVKRGTLRPGDVIVAGNTWARIRSLKNEAGLSINEATPGTPVEVDGWREQPAAGSEVLQAANEQTAKDVIEYRIERSDAAKMTQDMAAINESRRLDNKRQTDEGEENEISTAEAAGPKAIPFVIKADVSGSVEALVNSVAALGNNDVYAQILRSGVGPLGEFDIQHAATANGHVISFNLPIEPAIHRMAEAEGVKVLNHNIIYELVDDVKAKLSEYLPPLVKQRVSGEAEISQIFDITVKGREKIPIAGCKVRNGTINKNHKVRVLRGEEIIFDGNLSSLKNVKKDVMEMRKGTECGLGFENWTDFAPGDHVQCYEEILEKRYL